MQAARHFAGVPAKRSQNQTGHPRRPSDIRTQIEIFIVFNRAAFSEAEDLLRLDSIRSIHLTIL